MSREAYLKDLIHSGLIQNEHDQNMHLVKAAANPCIRVHGQFRHDRTFIIHVLESSPPPTREPPHMPWRGMAVLKDGMYHLRLPYNDIPWEYSYLTGYSPGKIEFAGEASEAWCKDEMYRPRVWRVEFGLHRGRPIGSGGRFENAEDFRQTVITDLRNLRRHGHKDTQLELARLWYGREDNPTAEVDSLVTEIKRYCRYYKLRWKVLKEEARHR